MNTTVNPTEATVEIFSKIIHHIESDKDSYSFDTRISIDSHIAGYIESSRIFSRTFEKCKFTLINSSNSSYCHTFTAIIQELHTDQNAEICKLELDIAIYGSESVPKVDLIERICNLQDYYKRKRDDIDKLDKINTFSQCIKAYGLETFIQ